MDNGVKMQNNETNRGNYNSEESFYYLSLILYLILNNQKFIRDRSKVAFVAFDTRVITSLCSTY